jgi:hypothetical protein
MLGLSLRKVGPGIFCTTMHRRIFGKTSDPHIISSTVLPQCSGSWFFVFPILKIVMKGMRLEAVSSRFLGHSVHCMSDVNVVLKRAGTILSDDINTFFIFFVWFLWPKFGNLIVTLCTTRRATCIQQTSAFCIFKTTGLLGTVFWIYCPYWSITLSQIKE